MHTFSLKFEFSKPITKLYMPGLAKILILLILLTETILIASDAIRCYSCIFNLAHCTSPLDCYNQPDVCSNTNFSPVLTQVDECEFGCEQYVVSDATGKLRLRFY